MCVNMEKPNILLICEVIPKAQKLPITLPGLSVPGYRNPISNFDPEGIDLGASGKRGLAVYIEDSLNFSPVKMNSNFNEYLVFEVNIAGPNKLLIALVYQNRQGISDRHSCEALSDFLRELANKNATHLIIVGDFNLKEIDWCNNVCYEGPNHVCQHFLACSQDCLLYQHILKPTRFRAGEIPSVLDVVFSNEEAMVQDVNYLSPLGHSDHACLVFHAKLQTSAHPSTIPKLDLNRGNYMELRHTLGQLDWNRILDSREVEVCWNGIITELNKAVDDNIPKRVVRPYKHLFMDLETKYLRRKKNKAYLEYMQNRNEATHNRYASLRNKLRKQTRKIRKNHETKLAEEFKEKPKKMWGYINSRLKTRSCIEELCRGDGTIARTDSEKAEELRKFFDSVFTNEDLHQLPLMTDRSL